MCREAGVYERLHRSPRLLVRDVVVDEAAVASPREGAEHAVAGADRVAAAVWDSPKGRRPVDEVPDRGRSQASWREASRRGRAGRGSRAGGRGACSPGRAGRRARTSSPCSRACSSRRARAARRGRRRCRNGSRGRPPSRCRSTWHSRCGGSPPRSPRRRPHIRPPARPSRSPGRRGASACPCAGRRGAASALRPRGGRRSTY